MLELLTDGKRDPKTAFVAVYMSICVKKKRIILSLLFFSLRSDTDEKMFLACF